MRRGARREFHFTENIIDGAQHRPDHESDHAAQHQSQRRAKHFHALVFSVLDVAIVEISHIGERCVERAGAFANAQHADNQGREQTEVVEGVGQAFAGSHLLHGTVQAVGHHPVANHFLGDTDRVEHGNAGSVHQAKGVGKARHDDFLDDRADHRDAQFGVIPQISCFW